MDAARERALREFSVGDGDLWNALSELMDTWRAEANENCTLRMQTVPRQFELAADYAAEARTYKDLMARIENFARNL